jgi:hypothetical protein
MATDRRLLAALRARVVATRGVGRLARALGGYFDRQAARVVARFLLGATNLIPAEDTDELVALLRRHLDGVIRGADHAAAAVLGVAPDPDDPARLAWIMGRVGERCRLISEATRAEIRRTVAEGMARGYHPDVIARGKPAEGFRGLRDVVAETYRGRARTIARTETALVWNQTATDRFGQAGITHVRVHDGAGCGWLSHEDSDTADGSIRALAEAQGHPVSHPNCRRAFAPLVERRLA